MSSLHRVNAVVKTFLRDAHMTRCVGSLERHYPEIQIVLVDDGHLTPEKTEFYAGMRSRGHIVEDAVLPFDSGFGAKSNMAMALCTRPYILCCNDDYLFDGDRDGVRKLATLLDALPEVGLACGTWCGRDYQGFLERRPGFVGETMFRRDPVDMERYNVERSSGVFFREVDLCAVYGMMRREVFTGTSLMYPVGRATLAPPVRVDARYKIGGEHGDWFMDIKDAGWKIAFTPEADIRQIDDIDHLAHPDYALLRFRQNWKRRYVEKHGPHTYRYFDGQEEVFK